VIAKTFSATVLGIDAYLIEVEVDVSVGMSVFNIVGLPDNTIKESRDRILSAVNNSGYSFPVRRVVVNLAPAPLRKIGSGFDLPIALALLGTMGLFPPENLSPLLDRIDIHLTVPAVAYEKLAEARQGESSKNIRERVVRARQVQEQRFRNSSSRNNSGMNRKEFETYAELADSSRKILQLAMTKMGLSVRAYDRILKVARTIADLAGEQKIDTPHVAEAIQYRNLDRPV